jgi:Lrp/AsnC family leucine-responsive transcriptional regulator
MEPPFQRIGEDEMSVSKVKIDRIDEQIIEALQKDARLSSADLAEVASLSASPCWRRVKRLEELGVIRGYHALIDPAKLGYEVMALVQVSLEQKGAAQLRAFEEAVSILRPVIACHCISGHYDYQLTVVAESLESFSDFARQHINGAPGVKEVTTSFVVKEIKAPVNPSARIGQ